MGVGRKFSGLSERNLRNRIKVKVCYWYEIILERGGIGGVSFWRDGEGCS